MSLSQKNDRKHDDGAAPGDAHRGPPEWTRYAGLGSDLIGPLLAGVLFGYWADDVLGSKPKGLLIGIALGFVTGFYLFFKTVFRWNRPKS